MTTPAEQKFKIEFRNTTKDDVVWVLRDGYYVGTLKKHPEFGNWWASRDLMTAMGFHGGWSLGVAATIEGAKQMALDGFARLGESDD